jgi:hypothetical protein
VMSKKAREGIEQGEAYPEPWFITNRWYFRLLYRGLLGRPMDGKRWSDSTFWRSATRGEDHWWLRLAGWQRAAVRVSGVYTLLLLLPALLIAHFAHGLSTALLLLAAHAGLGALLAAPPLAYRLLRDRGLRLPWPERTEDAEAGSAWRWSRRELIPGRRDWLEQKVRPVARTVAAKLNRRYHPAEAAQWVHVPRDYREQGGGAVEILLPQSFALNDGGRRSLAAAAAERLGIKDACTAWELSGNAPRLLLTAPVLPPDSVSFEDMLPALERAEEYTFLLGMSGSEALSISLKEDSPHLAVSAGSGAGKSELIKTLVAQAMHWGWSILLLDWKGESQEWCEGLLGVRYVRDIEALHDTMVEIGEEIEWRRNNRGREHPRILVVSEEWGITAPLLQSYWMAYRSSLEPEERRTTPLKSPAIEAGMKLNFTGRSLGFTQLLVAQRFSARVTNGNADLRESFTTIIMSRWKAQTFKMLAPDIRPIPKKLTKPGQWLAVTGDELVRFQGGLWSDEEAAQWATSGQQPPASPWSERYRPASSLQATDHSFSVAGPAAPGSPIAIEAEAVVLRKLTDMVDALDHLGVTARLLREWRDNEQDFPPVEGGTQFAGYLYDQSKVIEFVRRLRARQAAEQGGQK